MAEPISVAIPIAPKVDLTGLPDKFSGQFFKRWQQRMKIWLTMKGLLTVIQVTRPEPTDTDPKTAEIAQWTERDQIGRGAILSALSNTLFDVYCSDSYTAKSLWDELDRKYNTEEQGLEKYSVSKFMRYQMVEDRSVAEQTHEIINLEHALADAEMKLPEKFLVMSIVDKFPKSWENFGMTLKHQKGRLSLDDLMIAISIEEEHRNQTHKMPVEHQSRANLIVGKQRVNKINSNSKAINKGKTTKNKKPKANKPCWNCGQVGHWAKLCPNKKAKTGQAVVNMVVGGSSGASTSGATEGYVSVQPELLTIYEPCDWLIDTGANVHVCADKSLCVLSDHHWKDKTPPYSPSSNGVAERKNRTFKDMINSLLLTSGLPKYLWGEALNTACHILNRVPLKHNTSTPFELWKVFLGYVETSYALRFLVIKSEIPGIEVNTIVEFRDVVFLEDVFPMKTGIPSSVSLDDSLASTRSKRARVVKDFGSDFVTYNIEDDPVTFKDAMASLEAKQWKEAVKSEMDSIVSNGTWIVAKGFKQKEGIDYFDTYSPVARLTTIRVLIALASVYNLSIHQMDVKTAFLYGELEEEIYMDQPEGFVAHGNERKVCKLVKSLYGLKQAPKQWHEKFDQTILAFGFTVNENDKCIYCKVKGDRIIILCLYVDDILLIGSCIEIITETKSFLKNKFEMKDMGEADVILGIKLIRSTDGIAISQSHYVEKILEKFGYQNSRIAKTPYDSSVALFKNESGVSVAQLRYSQIIGSLQYLANGTRPDISFSVSKLARYTSCPDKTHWGALDRVLRYLKGTVSLAIHYGRFPAVLEGYSDASWIAKNSGSNGCSGYVFTLGGGAVSWKSAKQTLITRSTFEAELCALDTTGTEAEWLFGLLSQLPIVSQPLAPIAVHCDSQTTIAKVRSRKYNQKTKRHIQVRLKSIRALVSDRVIGIDFVGTKDNVADPLTKGLDLSQVNKSRLGMGLKTHQ
ncbi:Retrovirus-related Pol polyprotein from transposon TNT 1-94 [Sesamum angolense]|uniref:Retrovirus-related Pol polyprotein from transposon TNT 1-94 n=1 Tax=Sesamum angolense TaxID=2727404 RepID=A0AAE1W8T2_9LAMI|nr:Retrovirus-related Pol polyprotein from transposon TNT 1-94 [Sesamum angolense]